ncbi:hypothetical protein HS048_19805 [Planomonospora sp. ID91781]|uniref:Uncharacterized protein n=1 Tax=Planomonospora sphaerica TaxID=161355 RepID=A0A161LJY3_9ACTN|nr:MULTISPECIES: hypothetical protein [Planomonospora]MBG0822984.1 hypothetical protein [Planomonospora sp. ID91781]GAT69374.1 hypothetical protein PS9374_05049 [Planomonospora sphaerica]
MTHLLSVPVLVTTDLPPQTDLAAFGRVLAGAVAALPSHDGAPYPGHLHGRVFWLDRPAPPAESGAPGPVPADLRFAALLGFLSAAPGTSRLSAREVLADARAAIIAAVTAAYGDLGSAPAVLAIRSQDVRERTPETALTVVTPDADSSLIRAARTQPVG